MPRFLGVLRPAGGWQYLWRLQKLQLLLLVAQIFARSYCETLVLTMAWAACSATRIVLAGVTGAVSRGTGDGLTLYDCINGATKGVEGIAQQWEVVLFKFFGEWDVKVEFIIEHADCISFCCCTQHSILGTYHKILNSSSITYSRGKSLYG